MGIGLYAIRRRKDDSIVRDRNFGITRLFNPAHHLTPREHAPSAMDHELRSHFPEREAATGAEPEV